MLTALLLCLATKPLASPAPEQLPKRAGQFIEYLRSVAPVDYRRLVPARPIDPEIVLGFVSAKGVLISDVNEPPPKQVSTERLRRELKGGRGDSYRYFVHLAHSISRLPPNAKLPIQKKDGKTSVLLPDYTLVFAEEGGSLKLESIEFITAYGS